MKKLLAVALIALALLAVPVYGDGDPYPDWELINGVWVYVGNNPNPPPPPPIKL
ncbi:MAG: hypothetical protein RBS89_01390 [Candidatus Delongbacteria bacterium]|jgi:hypothetical protein|nr:hypothetical protein [Candidatus Delongbacteria bacterium]